MRCASLASARLEAAFFALGVRVARRPKTVICWCLLSTLAAVIALLVFGLRREASPYRLWVPPESRFARDTEWLARRFGAVVRPQRAIVVAPDALEPEVVARLARLRDRVAAIAEPPYSEVCLRVPVLPPLVAELGARLADKMPQGAYCAALRRLTTGCLVTSPLDVWREGMSAGDFAAALVGTDVNPKNGHPADFVSTLGGVRRDGNGAVASARAAMLTWYVRVNFSAVDEDSVGNDAGTEEWTSAAALAWESRFLEAVADEERRENVTGSELFYEAGRSFGDASGGVMFRDGGKLAVGIFLMFVYIQLVLSKFDRVEARFALGSVGLLVVGMALAVACALCSLLGVPYGPVHDSLPFLLMGLGVDDMFVMKACWESMSDAEKRSPLPERVGTMLRHAGVSIVVTSFTDVVAFLVGSITILPSLRSFCVYAACGVFFIFVFAVTFYVAAFALDVRRIEDQRNGFLFCIKHSGRAPSSPHRRSMSHAVLERLYSKFVFTNPVRTAVVLFTVGMTAFSAVALFRLEQRFDPTWFVPEDSYYSAFLKARREFYPNMGFEGSVFFGALNYSRELPKIFETVDRLKNETGVFQDVDSWTFRFRKFVPKAMRDGAMSESEWKTQISRFLHSPSGSRYRLNFRFRGDLECGSPAPDVSMSSVDFTFKIFEGPSEYLPAKRRIESIVDGANFTTGDKFATVWAKTFANWVTDEVIDVEVERNLELALVCVMACTAILIADLQMCFWIFVCVALTLVNVCGWMQRWGLTVDIVTCVGLELGIGFCVDYAAHIGHTFLTFEGTRLERALNTVTSMGAAVLYGGGSTLLSLSVLSVSETYVFKTFFKIFFLVIIFGLFHGLLFLPVILSLIGPRSSHEESPNKRTPRERSSELDDPDKGTQLEPINCDDGGS